MKELKMNHFTKQKKLQNIFVNKGPNKVNYKICLPSKKVKENKNKNQIKISTVNNIQINKKILRKKKRFEPEIV